MKHFTSSISSNSQSRPMRSIGSKSPSNAQILCFSEDEIYGWVSLADFSGCSSGSPRQVQSGGPDSSPRSPAPLRPTPRHRTPAGVSRKRLEQTPVHSSAGQTHPLWQLRNTEDGLPKSRVRDCLGLLGTQTFGFFHSLRTAGQTIRALKTQVPPLTP